MDTHEHTQLCESIGWGSGIPIEVEFVQGEWIPATVGNINTGRNHHDGAAVVSIHVDGKRTVTDVCVIDRWWLLDVESDTPMRWKAFGEKWIDDDEGDDDMVFEFIFTTRDALFEMVSDITSNILSKVLRDNFAEIDAAGTEVQQSVFGGILALRNDMVNQVVLKIESGGPLTAGDAVLLDMSEICDLMKDVCQWMHSDTKLTNQK